LPPSSGSIACALWPTQWHCSCPALPLTTDQHLYAATAASAAAAAACCLLCAAGSRPMICWVSPRCC
jgi:hypothetical protein